MLNVPEKISDILHKDGVQKLFRIHFPNGEHEDILNDHIEEETVSFKESVNSGDEFRLGLCETPEISFDLWNVGEIVRGTEIECYNNIPYENPDVLFEYPEHTIQKHNHYLYGWGFTTAMEPWGPSSGKVNYTGKEMFIEITTSEEVILKSVRQNISGLLGADDSYNILSNGTDKGTFFRINSTHIPYVESIYSLTFPLDMFFGTIDGTEPSESIKISYRLVEGCYIDNPDSELKTYYPIKYGNFVITEASIYSDTPNKLSIRANNYLIDNLTNDLYDDKSFVKTKKTFTYKYDPLRRAIAASGITKANMWTTTAVETSSKTVKPAEFFSRKLSVSLKVKQKKKSDALKSTKLTVKFWINGDSDLLYDDTQARPGLYHYGKCTEDNLYQVLFHGNPNEHRDEMIQKYTKYLTDELDKKGIKITKKVTDFIKDEIAPVWFGCYLTSIKNYKKSTTYDRYATPHKFDTCYYTRFTADSAENYDYIIAIPNGIRLTITASTAIENWGKKKEISFPATGSYPLFNIEGTTVSSRDNAEIRVCISEMFGEFEFEEKATKVDDSAYYMLFNQVKVRDILSGYFEFKGSYGRVDRNGSFEVSSLVDSLGLPPSEDLYPSDELYPLDASYDKIIGMDAYSDLFHINNEEKKFGALYAYYTDSNDETQLLIEYADGYDEDTDPTTYRSYIMDSNIFILRKNWTASKLKTYLKDVISMLNKLVYMQGEATIVGRPDIQAGDTILIEDTHGIHCLVVSDRTINGVQHLVDTIKSV